MSLVLVGKQPLDQLEKYARTHFSSIVNKNLEVANFELDPMFDSSSLGHLIKYVPIKESKILTIKWPRLMPTKQYWDGNPLHYISYVLGHEGKNSLLSELIKQDLAVDIVAGPWNRL